MPQKKKGKRLILTTYHLPDKSTETPWADVWIKTTVKPSRKRLHLAPTLIGQTDMEWDDELDKKLKRKPDPEHAAAKAAFASGAPHFIGTGPEHMANVYANEHTINQAVAERLCLAYAQSLGIHATRVKWERTTLHSNPA